MSNFAGYLEKIGPIFRICCALINCFCKPLSSDSPFHLHIARRALELISTQNEMQRRVKDERLDRYTKDWRLASQDTFTNFPVLTMEDLKLLTLGIYQIRLAHKYTVHHLNQESKYIIYLNDNFANVVRARIESRFKSKPHMVWISFNPDASGVDGICGYYCQCKQGARTVGMCAHVCSVIWYLGFYRHQGRPEIVRRRRALKIRDAEKELPKKPKTKGKGKQQAGTSNEGEAEGG